jgi:hypothetical protein
VVVQLALTLALAQVSYMLLEQPIRRYRGSNRRPTFALGALATGGVAVAAVAVVPAALGEYWETDEATVSAAAIDVTGSLAPLQLATQPPAIQSTVPATTVPEPSTVTVTTDGQIPTVASTPTTSTTTTSTSTTTTEPALPALSRPVRIVVAGDSTANATAAGLVEWAAKNPDMAQVEVVGAPGCGFVTGGERRAGGFQPYPPPCDEWLSRVLPDSVTQLQPDVVMLMVTTWDVVDHKWDGGEELSPLDAEFARRIDTDYRAITDRLLASGAGSIAWIAPPVPNAWWTDDTTGQQDPARHAVVRGVIDEIAAQLPDQVGVIDLATWLDQNGLTDDHEVRPDGVHLDTVAAEDIAEQFLGERLIRIALA